MEYAERQPIRTAILEYLQEQPAAVNFDKLVHELAPEFGVDPVSYGFVERRQLVARVATGLADLIEIEETIAVLPPLEHAGPNAALMNRFTTK